MVVSQYARLSFQYYGSGGGVADGSGDGSSVGGAGLVGWGSSLSPGLPPPRAAVGVVVAMTVAVGVGSGVLVGNGVGGNVAATGIAASAT